MIAVTPSMKHALDRLRRAAANQAKASTPKPRIYLMPYGVTTTWSVGGWIEYKYDADTLNVEIKNHIRGWTPGEEMAAGVFDGFKRHTANDPWKDIVITAGNEELQIRHAVANSEVLPNGQLVVAIAGVIMRKDQRNGRLDPWVPPVPEGLTGDMGQRSPSAIEKAAEEEPI